MGIIAGIFTGIGIGGGAVLILLLDIFLGYNQHMSQAINLICFIPSAIVSIVFNMIKKNINIKKSISILIFGVMGACIGSLISQNINVNSLRKLFGIFLLIIGMYEIFLLIHDSNKIE